MIEAMGCGCPVLASDIPAVRDVIRDGETGLLVISADSKKLESKILDILASPTKLVARLARQSVLEKFSWKKSTKLYSSHIKKLIANT